MWKEFKEFAAKGNVVDLAIGVIIGGAFGKIVTSLVNDLIMPLISQITGKVDFTNMFLALDGNHYPTLEAVSYTHLDSFGPQIKTSPEGMSRV